MSWPRRSAWRCFIASAPAKARKCMCRWHARIAQPLLWLGQDAVPEMIERLEKVARLRIGRRQTAQRALERTLVATGNLLVPSGFAEVEPLFGYTRRELSALGQANVPVLFNLNRNEFNWTLGARLGSGRGRWHSGRPLFERVSRCAGF